MYLKEEMVATQSVSDSSFCVYPGNAKPRPAKEVVRNSPGHCKLLAEADQSNQLQSVKS